MDPDPDPKLSFRASAFEAGLRLAVEIVRRAGPWPQAGLDAALTEAAQAAFAAAGTDEPAEIALVLTGDAEMRDLNARWRGQDKPTNVLSFPLDEPSHGDGTPAVLGDVVLAYETVAREAGARGLTLAAHAAHLVVHGVLHLCGYDHADDNEARVMEALESRIVVGLGYADPYAEGVTAGDASVREPAL